MHLLLFLLLGSLLYLGAAKDDNCKTMPGVPGYRDIVINEILYAPEDSKLEFIELFNRSGLSFDLSTLSLADSRRKPRPLHLTPKLLHPGEYAVLIRNRPVFQATFPGVEALRIIGWPALNNGGDTPMLLYGDVVIDSVAYDGGWGTKGSSLERIDPHGSSQWPKNWSSSTAMQGATPGEENANYAPDHTPPVPLFAQQITPTTAEVLFDGPVQPETLSPDHFHIGIQVPSEVEIQGYGERMLLSFGSPLSASNLTVNDLQDIPGNRLSEATIPLALQALPGDLVINEIMYEPIQDLPAPQPEYIELFNATEHWISLHGLYLTDTPDAHGAADTLRGTEERIALAPDSYAVFFSEHHAVSEATIPEASSLALAFPRTFTYPQTVFLPVPGKALGLRNDGDLIRLHSSRSLLDEVRYDPHWHHPHLRDVRGTSLERVAAHLPSDAATTWTSSLDEAGGTPGQSNAVHSVSEDESVAWGMTVSPSPFSPDGDGLEDVAEIRYILRNQPALLRLRIYDFQGRLIRTLEAAGLTTGTGSLLWDGRREDGQPARIGPYIIHLESYNALQKTAISYKRTVIVARPLG